jgi:hypothetical protein
MLKMRRYSAMLLLPFVMACRSDVRPLKDTPYREPVSVKYTVNPRWKGARFKKTVVDGDNNVYVLTDMGLFRDFPGEVLSKDFMYASLADKIPVDICIQEGSNYLYYLYHDRFLTNFHAGAICGRFPAGSYSKMAVNSEDEVLLVGERMAALFHRNEKKADLPVLSGRVSGLFAYGKKFWALTPNAVYRLDEKRWIEIHSGENLSALAFDGQKIAVGTTDGYYVMDHQGKILEEKNNRVPVPCINRMASVNNQWWFATSDGAFVKEPDRFRYFASRRWLDRNDIVDMTADTEGNIYLLTPAGLNKIKFRDQTLLGKAIYLQDNLRKYHLRYGWSAESRLLDPDDPTTICVEDSDNDGLWTSFYLGSQALRYAVTGEEAAKRYVWESFEAFERNISIHQVKGFSGRTFERKGYVVHDLDRWRQATDPDWLWKGTTSSDEFVGYIFVASVIDRFAAENAREKKRVADYIDAIMTHIIEHNYYFVDYDGQPTLWGRWHPEYVNAYPPAMFDRRLNSSLIVAGLQLAWSLTGKDIYKSETFRVMDEWGYLQNMQIPMKNIAHTTGVKHQGIGMGEEWNHSDDEMAFLTYWVLYHHALNDTLKAKYADIIKDHWEIEKPERNALWNLISYGTCGEIDLESTLWYLREFPADCRRYAVRNSHRKDLELLPQDIHANFREQTNTQLLTKGERTANRHNTNEFMLDGGRGKDHCLAGDEYLLPYWLARYLKVIE